MKTKEKLKALAKDEFETLAIWAEQEPFQSPTAEVGGLLRRMIATYHELTKGDQRAKNTLFLLRQQMGFIPKSERGSQEQNAKKSNSTEAVIQPSLEELETWDPVKKAEYDALKKKRGELLYQVREYDRKLRQAKGCFKTVGPQMEFDLARPNEALFTFPVVGKGKDDEDRKVDRMSEFQKTSGFHQSKDHPQRIDLDFTATTITYHVETLTDPETGKSVRASTQQDGPAGSGLTWKSIANLVKLHVGFAIPINRMAMMIGQPEFTSGKIYRVLKERALKFVGIYLYLAENLSDASILSGDDTTTKVLNPAGSGEPDPICDEVDARLGWIQPRADGKGMKKALNVSLIVGKTHADPRSTIRFFRTHFGSVGNLLTKILESRSPKAGTVIFQGDLSSTNLPTRELREMFHLILSGCGAHARRPFWRHRKDDESLCYYMLRGFLALAQLEKRITAMGRTRENTLKLRGRYGKWLWQTLKNRCIAATTGEIPGPATYRKGVKPNIWPPDSELGRACQYIIRHFDELTLYLTHPELEYTNNGRERALRIEKIMLDASKFRKTKRGRVVLDILRTLNATATAANIDLTPYFAWVDLHEAEALEHPEKFTPFAFALYLDKKKAEEKATPATIPLD